MTKSHQPADTPVKRSGISRRTFMKGAAAGAAGLAMASTTLGGTALAAEAAAISVKRSACTVTVNGKDVEFQAYLINSNNYLKLRDLAYILNGSNKQFSVSFTSADKKVALTSGQSYSTVGGEMSALPATANAKLTCWSVALDGKAVEALAYLINGNNYFKLRDICAALDVYVEYDAATNGVALDTSKGYVPEGSAALAGALSGLNGGKHSPSSQHTWTPVVTEEPELNPEDFASLGEAAYLFVKAAGWEYVKPAANRYSDLDADDDFAGEILRLVAKGVIRGEDGKIHPNSSLTREEFFVMYGKVLELKGKNTNTIFKFNDVYDIAEANRPVFSQLYTMGILTGYPEDNTFCPANKVTIAEIQEALGRHFDPNISMAPAGITLLPTTGPGIVKNFNRYGNMNPSNEMYINNYLMREEPFHIIGGIYFVGNTWCSSYLIDTGDGLILLDNPCSGEFWLLIDSIYRLGFDPKDIKYLVMSHAHPDHYGCVKPLLALYPHIKTFVGDVDAPAIVTAMQRTKFERSYKTDAQGFVPDVLVKDGDHIKLGNTDLRCVLTPGHTVGVQSHFWTVTDHGKTYRIGLYGGAGFGSMAGYRLKARGMSDAEVTAYQQVFSDSIDKVWDEPVDVMLGNHPFHADLFEKNERVQRGDKNAFIDPTEWKRYHTELRECYKEFLKLDEAGVTEMYKYSSLMVFRNSPAVIDQHEWPFAKQEITPTK